MTAVGSAYRLESSPVPRPPRQFPHPFPLLRINPQVEFDGAVDEQSEFGFGSHAPTAIPG